MLIITFGFVLVFNYPPLAAKQVQFKNEVEIDTLNLSDISKVLQKDFEDLKTEKIETKKKLQVLTDQNKKLIETNLELNSKVVPTKVVTDTIYLHDTVVRIDTLKKVKNFWGKEKTKN